MPKTYKGSDPRQSEQTEKKFLTTVSNICFNAIMHEKIIPIKSDITLSEKTILNWIKKTSKCILTNVIPNKFWSEFKMTKPKSPLSHLCLKSDIIGINVLHLVLWSCCSKRCNEEITSCLNTEIKKWSIERNYNLKLFLQAYVICVQGHVWHSLANLNSDDKVVGINENTPVLKEAYCLHAAVVNSSSTLRMLSYNRRSPTGIIMAFVTYLKSNMNSSSIGRSVDKLPCVVFADNDLDNVTHVSIAKWFKLDIICPNLKRLFQFPSMALFSEGIHNIITNKETLDDNDLLNLKQLASVCALDMIGIGWDSCDGLVGIRFIIYTVLLKNFVDKGEVQNAGLSHPDEILIQKLLQSSLLQQDMKPGLKKLLEDPSMSHWNVNFLQHLVLHKEYIQNFCNNHYNGEGDIAVTDQTMTKEVITSNRKRKSSSLEKAK